jgi:hypothetical protein
MIEDIMDTVFIKPALHKETGNPFPIRFPNSTRLLSVEGEPVGLDGYWQQRIAHGDVIVTEPPVEPAPPAESDTNTRRKPARVDEEKS